LHLEVKVVLLHLPVAEEEVEAHLVVEEEHLEEVLT
jgi:hypothetical protein